MDEHAKQTALRQLSYGMYIVGSKGEGDTLNGMTATWVMQISFDPPLVAVAVEADARTRQLIDQGQVFSVNILGPGQLPIVETFVKPARRAGNKLEDEEFSTGVTGAPLLTAALSHFECEVTERHQTGTHVLYVGRVVGAGVNREGPPLTLHEIGWHYGG